jgi:hypothetical protein
MSGAQYYLDPFDVEMPSGQSGRNKYKKKRNCYVVDAPSIEVRQIPSNATLIIDGHSSSGSPTISRFQFPDGKANQTIRFERLAELLSGARLPVTHGLIRLLACEGNSYAQNLAIDLGKVGYNDIAVGGYTVTNYQVEGQRTRFGPDHYDENDDLIGDKPIKWYNASGKQIQKPYVLDRKTGWQEV